MRTELLTLNFEKIIIHASIYLKGIERRTCLGAGIKLMLNLFNRSAKGLGISA